MAKLYFRYGVMGSSKSAEILMVTHNYHEREKQVLLLKPDMDIRDGADQIQSRIGLAKPCELASRYVSTEGELVGWASLQERGIDCILIDEAQFLTPSQVEGFALVVDELDIPVICYGLRTDFQGRLFPGSNALFAMAGKIEEIKTICWCGSKATYNARYDENGIIRDGDQVVLGGSERYIGVCRKHHREGKLFRLSSTGEGAVSD